MPAPSVSVWPAPSVATFVFRQNRRPLYASGTWIALVEPSQLIWPETAFSGWQPSAAGNSQPERHSPVQTFGSGSHLVLHWFSPREPSL